MQQYQRKILGTQPTIMLAFEGIEGSGKTTLIESVRELLAPWCHVVTSYAPSWRDAQLKSEDPSGYRQSLRQERIKRYTDDFISIQQRLDNLPNGTIVLQDRWADSTYVYQMDGERGIGDPDPYSGVRYPDLTFYLPVPPSVAYSRLVFRGERPDKYDLSRLASNYDRHFIRESRSTDRIIGWIPWQVDSQKQAYIVQSYLSTLDK
jgi:thymidylate kinase